MSLRINHNANSLKAHRNLQKNSDEVSKSLERLSSGLRINRAGDGPAALVASEQMRTQIASIDQALRNSEVSVSMVQTAEGSLGELNSMLVGMRQLAIHAANEGANDAVMVEADQSEINNMLGAIDRIAGFTRFGTKKLLDGSNGVSGTAIGDDLQFVEATTKSKSSGTEGFEVKVKSLATQASLTGTVALTDAIIKSGERLTLSEGGKSASYTTQDQDTLDSAVRNFATAAKDAGMKVSIGQTATGTIQITHQKFGSAHGFEASSTTAGILSIQAGAFQAATQGKNLKGTIDDEATVGNGDTMMGITGNEKTEGLNIRFRGQLTGAADTDGFVSVGRVSVAQNSLAFQVGSGQGQVVKIALKDTAANQLGRGVDTMSNFGSLAEIDVRSGQGAADAMTIIDEAINQVTTMRAELGSFQKNTLEVNIANMRTASENLVAAESNIRDVDMAQELANFTRNNLMMQSSAAMLAQANQIPRKVLRLLED